nr:FAD-binding protein [Pseudomonas sp.]
MTTHHADVIVIGGGVAGLTAAVRAGQLGLSTLVLEKLQEDRYVCNSRLTGGVFHLALNDINQPADTLVDAIMTSTQGTADPALAHLLARSAKPVVSWLQSLGIRFIRGADPWHSFVLAPPGIAALGRQWEGRAGDVLLRTLESKLNAAQGKILRGHAAVELLMDEGRCVGVRAQCADGPIDCLGKAVVLADGGFQANLELLAQHISPNPSQVVQRNARTGMGDALRMATQAGAASSSLDGFYGHVLSRDALTNDVLWPYPWLDELLKYYVMVDKQGKRFADEGCGGVYVANKIAALPDPAGTFVICDEAGWQTAGKERFL